MAPLVRTGGSRHTGLAALPHRNIHEFIVETIKADDAEYLSSVFTDAQLTAKDTLLFLGEQFKMFEVLEFITEHKILISKIERVEPSLECIIFWK